MDVYENGNLFLAGGSAGTLMTVDGENQAKIGIPFLVEGGAARINDVAVIEGVPFVATPKGWGKPSHLGSSEAGHSTKSIAYKQTAQSRMVIVLSDDRSLYRFDYENDIKTARWHNIVCQRKPLQPFNKIRFVRSDMGVLASDDEPVKNFAASSGKGVAIWGEAGVIQHEGREQLSYYPQYDSGDLGIGEVIAFAPFVYGGMEYFAVLGSEGRIAIVTYSNKKIPVKYFETNGEGELSEREIQLNQLTVIAREDVDARIENPAAIVVRGEDLVLATRNGQLWQYPLSGMVSTDETFRQAREDFMRAAAKRLWPEGGATGAFDKTGSDLLQSIAASADSPDNYDEDVYINFMNFLLHRYQYDVQHGINADQKFEELQTLKRHIDQNKGLNYQFLTKLIEILAETGDLGTVWWEESTGELIFAERDFNIEFRVPVAAELVNATLSRRILAVTMLATVRDYYRRQGWRDQLGVVNSSLNEVNNAFYEKALNEILLESNYKIVMDWVHIVAMTPAEEKDDAIKEQELLAKMLEEISRTTSINKKVIRAKDFLQALLSMDDIFLSQYQGTALMDGIVALCDSIVEAINDVRSHPKVTPDNDYYTDCVQIFDALAQVSWRNFVSGLERPDAYVDGIWNLIVKEWPNALPDKKRIMPYTADVFAAFVRLLGNQGKSLDDYMYKGFYNPLQVFMTLIDAEWPKQRLELIAQVIESIVQGKTSWVADPVTAIREILAKAVENVRAISLISERMAAVGSLMITAQHAGQLEYLLSLPLASNRTLRDALIWLDGFNKSYAFKNSVALFNQLLNAENTGNARPLLPEDRQQRISTASRAAQAAMERLQGMAQQPAQPQPDDAAVSAAVDAVVNHLSEPRLQAYANELLALGGKKKTVVMTEELVDVDTDPVSPRVVPVGFSARYSFERTGLIFPAHSSAKRQGVDSEKFMEYVGQTVENLIRQYPEDSECLLTGYLYKIRRNPRGDFDQAFFQQVINYVDNTEPGVYRAIGWQNIMATLVQTGCADKIRGEIVPGRDLIALLIADLKEADTHAQERLLVWGNFVLMMSASGLAAEIQEFQDGTIANVGLGIVRQVDNSGTNSYLLSVLARAGMLEKFEVSKIKKAQIGTMMEHYPTLIYLGDSAAAQQIVSETYERLEACAPSSANDLSLIEDVVQMIKSLVQAGRSGELRRTMKNGDNVVAYALNSIRAYLQASADPQSNKSYDEYAGPILELCHDMVLVLSLPDVAAAMPECRRYRQEVCDVVAGMLREDTNFDGAWRLIPLLIAALAEAGYPLESIMTQAGKNIVEDTMDRLKESKPNLDADQQLKNQYFWELQDHLQALYRIIATWQPQTEDHRLPQMIPPAGDNTAGDQPVVVLPQSLAGHITKLRTVVESSAPDMAAMRANVADIVREAVALARPAPALQEELLEIPDSVIDALWHVATNTQAAYLDKSLSILSAEKELLAHLRQAEPWFDQLFSDINVRHADLFSGKDLMKYLDGVHSPEIVETAAMHREEQRSVGLARHTALRDQRAALEARKAAINQELAENVMSFAQMQNFVKGFAQGDNLFDLQQRNDREEVVIIRAGEKWVNTFYVKPSRSTDEILNVVLNNIEILKFVLINIVDEGNKYAQQILDKIAEFDKQRLLIAELETIERQLASVAQQLEIWEIGMAVPVAKTELSHEESAAVLIGAAI
ncbi:MAG: hypothetical protein NC924_04350 [Candidatus Omnitrophica bacterium]|nr:hypothetical protein [Candidatus Omnitrophota bacterium]